MWGGCGVSNINKIIKLQKRAISLCANNHSRNSLLQHTSVYSYFTLIRFKKISKWDILPNTLQYTLPSTLPSILYR